LLSAAPRARTPGERGEAPRAKQQGHGTRPLLRRWAAAPLRSGTLRAFFCSERQYHGHKHNNGHRHIVVMTSRARRNLALFPCLCRSLQAGGRHHGCVARAHTHARRRAARLRGARAPRCAPLRMIAAEGCRVCGLLLGGGACGCTRTRTPARLACAAEGLPCTRRRRRCRLGVALALAVACPGGCDRRKYCRLACSR
jgi:hypothetical protein